MSKLEWKTKVSQWTVEKDSFVARVKPPSGGIVHRWSVRKNLGIETELEEDEGYSCCGFATSEDSAKEMAEIALNMLSKFKNGNGF